MSFDTLAAIALMLAAAPAGLFVLNLLVYHPLSRGSRRAEAHSESAEEKSVPPHPGSHGVSVLIPARNEEQNICATLEALLKNRDCHFEVIVLDDHSTDGTAAIAKGFTLRDARVRLESAPPLPAGWCGKQHACQILGRLARHPLLVFIDADVRLASDALTRMVSFMERTEASRTSASMKTSSGWRASRPRM